MGATELDWLIDRLSANVNSLSRRGQAGFFWLSGHALFPLFQRFHRETGWGDPDALSRGLDVGWRFAVGGDGGDHATLLQDLLDTTPQGDEFDAPKSTFAQDAVICVAVAVRCASGEPVNPGGVEYALEPLLNVVCERHFGLLYPGSDEEVAWYEVIVADPAIGQAVAFCDEAVAALRGSRPIQAGLLDRLRHRSVALLPSGGWG